MHHIHVRVHLHVRHMHDMHHIHDTPYILHTWHTLHTLHTLYYILYMICMLPTHPHPQGPEVQRPDISAYLVKQMDLACLQMSPDSQYRQSFVR